MWRYLCPLKYLHGPTACGGEGRGGKRERGEGCMCGPVSVWDVGNITLQRVPELAKLVYAATRENEISWWNGENVVVCQRTSLLN